MTKKWYNVDMNNSKNQCIYRNQMQKDIRDMYKHYKENGEPVSEPVPVPEPEPEKISFTDDFETDWFLSNAYSLHASETFELSWFDDNNYMDMYEDKFENNWFAINTFINQGNEDFEDVSWDE